MALNVTTAVFGDGCNTATATPSLVQWDKGQKLKISGVDLPDSYKVEFSTAYTRNAIPEIGAADGVDVPNELLQRSAPITAYIVLSESTDDRGTEFWVTIHITPREPPETVTPDPEQMDVIDRTIAVLNEGAARATAAADSAEEAVTHYPKIEGGTWRVWDAENETWVDTGIAAAGVDGEDGEDGVSPTVTVTEITGGHRVTVTDKTGDHVFDVMDGEDGDPATNLVESVAGKTGVVTLDGGDVGFDDAETYEAGTVGAELTGLSRHLSDKADKTAYVTLSGTIITQTGVDNTVYLCGELAELTFTAPATGITVIRFTSGSTPTVITLNGITMPDDWTGVCEANKRYDIGVLNGDGLYCARTVT